MLFKTTEDWRISSPPRTVHDVAEQSLVRVCNYTYCDILQWDRFKSSQGYSLWSLLGTFRVPSSTCDSGVGFEQRMSMYLLV